MPQIFILVDWFLPAYKAGGPIQSLANQVAQQEEGLLYNIICSNKDVDGRSIDAKPDQWITFNPWTRIWYSSNGTNKGLYGAADSILWAQGLYSWQYNLKPLLLAKAKRKIVSVRGILHPGALSQKGLKKRVYLRLWKLAGLHKRVEFHASNSEEEAHIQQVFGPTVKIHIAANYPRMLQRQEVRAKQQGHLNLVSVALLSPMKNILLVLQTLGQCKAAIHYHICGAVKDKAYWSLCQREIASLPANIQVTYHGALQPGLVPDVLAMADVFVLPSKSENFGHAIYEALTAGKPVITSHYTPWQKLKDSKAGLNVSLENGTELEQAIAFFAAVDKPELEGWSRGADEYASKAVNIEAIKLQYRQMFLSAS